MNFDRDRLLNLYSGAQRKLIESLYNKKDQPLNDVINYVLAGEGKRVRAQMTMLVAATLGAKPEDALVPAVAVEMVHAYSLVHDDLPCMDDDKLRRGRPTAHMAFDEAKALLAGDALLSDSFLLLSDSHLINEVGAKNLTSGLRNMLVRELAMAAGSLGMVRGQASDLHWTGRDGAGIRELDDIHRKKTGALLGAASAMGAIVAEAASTTIDTWRDFGVDIGHAFQIIDDLLDGNEGTGKSVGKDAAQNKLTYLSSLSRGDAKKKAEFLTDEAMNLLEKYKPEQIKPLKDFVAELLVRAK